MTLRKVWQIFRIAEIGGWVKAGPAPKEPRPAAPQEPGEHKQPTAPLPQVPPAPDDPGSGPLGLPRQHTQPAVERLASQLFSLPNRSPLPDMTESEAFRRPMPPPLRPRPLHLQQRL